MLPDGKSHTMLDPVPPHLELIIYGYLLLVAAIGLAVQFRLLRRYRRDGYADDGSI